MGRTTRRIKQVRVSVYHHDCGISEPSEKNSEVAIEQASPISTLKKTRRGGIYEVLWRVRAPDGEALERYLKGFKAHKTTAQVEILEKNSSDALLLWRTHPMTSTYDTILKKHIIHSSSVLAQGGYEIHNVLSTNPNDLKRMLEELSCLGEVKVLRIGDFSLATDQKPRLTKKQQEALGTALAQGYYRWPRRVTLEELALATNVSRRSFHDRLRRAEANVFPLLVKDFLKEQKNEHTCSF
jgi:predicted DNA binding protein